MKIIKVLSLICFLFTTQNCRLEKAKGFRLANPNRVIGEIVVRIYKPNGAERIISWKLIGNRDSQQDVRIDKSVLFQDGSRCERLDCKAVLVKEILLQLIL